jgi:hypothetical protein
MRTHWMPDAGPAYEPHNAGSFTYTTDVIGFDGFDVAADFSIDASQDDAGSITILSVHIKTTKAVTTGPVPRFELAYTPAPKWLVEAVEHWAETPAGEQELSNAAFEGGL